MRVLYVNHTADVSGGEHSLLGLLGALPDTVQPLVATPPGRLRERGGGPRHPHRRRSPATAGSLRLHPLHTPRTVAELSVAAVQVRRAARRHRAELVHANSIRAGIVARARRVPPAPESSTFATACPPGRSRPRPCA